MNLNTRISKAEKIAKPKKTALFVIHYGKAEGRAWWRDDLRWANLSRPEYDHLVAELKAEGVKVITIDIIGVHKKGHGIDGWNQAVKL